MLDLTMRDASHDQSSLRELFGWMNQHYAKQGKFFADSEGVRQTAELLSGADLRDFFEKYVSGVDEIPWDSFFAGVGLHVTKAEIAIADPGFEAVLKFDQPPSIVKVAPASEAKRAGVKPGDEILEINGQPAGREFKKMIANLAPGATLRLLIRRDRVSHPLQWKIDSRKETVFRLQDVRDITPQQKARRVLWLFGEARTTQ